METIESFINKLSIKYPDVLKTVSKQQMADLYKEDQKIVQCCFIPNTGANKGVRCSANAKKDSEACSKHLRFINKSPKENGTATSVPKENGTVTSVPKEKVTEVTNSKEPVFTPVVSKNVCKYVFTKGKLNKGKTCGVKCKNDEDLFCVKHKNMQKTPKKTGLELKPIKATSCRSKGAEHKFCTDKNLGEKIYNPLTKILFKSENDKTAIGTYDVENSNILSLTEKDIETCNKYGYKYEVKEEDKEETELSQEEKTSDPENQSDQSNEDIEEED